MFNSSVRVYNFYISIVLISLYIIIYSSIVLIKNLGNACVPSGSLGSVVIAYKTIILVIIIR